MFRAVLATIVAAGIIALGSDLITIASSATQTAQSVIGAA
jgi:hypothetical protein